MDGRILVIEDDHPLRDLLLRGLREEGFAPVPASDGAGAIRPARERFDAVVLDADGGSDHDGRPRSRPGPVRARRPEAPRTSRRPSSDCSPPSSPRAYRPGAGR